jgi:hypothetical protein
LEIKDKVEFWHTKLESRLSRFNSMANFYRLLKPSRSADFSGFSNPQVTETTRATEAIATFIYRALTSAQPNFQFLSKNPMVSQEQLWRAESVVEWQKTVTNFNRKLMRGCRSAALFGTLPFEEPWVQNFPYYEATDFEPLSLLQFAFDPLCFDISLSPWHAKICYVTDGQLRGLAKRMPDIWDPMAIEDAIAASQNMKNLSPEVLARMTAAGYQTYSGSNGSNVSQVYQLIVYYGPVKDDPMGNVERCIATVNDLKTVRGHNSEYKRRPFNVGYMAEFEMEPYAYGVGSIAEQTQPEMNSNQGRIHDVITFSLFNQWLIDRAANVKTSQLRIKPWGGIEVDGNVETAIKALRPQIEGATIGLNFQEMMKREFRATTGASDSLQAIVTEATATESSIAQTEAVRRLSVQAEIFSEPVLREHFSKMHENNQLFLDQPFSIAVTGQPDINRIYPSDLQIDVEVATKIVTDKDFRPQRNKDLLQFLQVVTSIRNQNPQMGQVNLEPFVEEFARGVGMNPKSVWSSIPQLPGLTAPGGAPQPGVAPTAMDRVSNIQNQMQSVQSNAGELGAAAHSDAMAAV